MNRVRDKEVVKTLKKAKKLLKSGWTKLASARNKYGNPVSIDCKNAVRFCASGAVLRSTQDEATQNRIYGLFDILLRESIVAYNDRYHVSKNDILDVFDKAIKNASSK